MCANIIVKFAFLSFYVNMDKSTASKNVSENPSLSNTANYNFARSSIVNIPKKNKNPKKLHFQQNVI